MCEQYRDLQIKLRGLRDSVSPKEDGQKLKSLQVSILEQLASFGFSSIPLADVRISDDSYHPTRDGVELGFLGSASASDSIRLMWAFLIGIMEVSAKLGGKHPGLLILDEPRQQSARDDSFAECLKRASQAGARDQQVIVFTSEPVNTLTTMLNGIECNLTVVPGHTIIPT